MTTESKILVGLILALGAFNVYTWSETRDDIRTLRNMSGTQCPPMPNQAAALSQIQRNQISAAASHAYFEHLLEGLVRHQGLPLDRARRAFDQHVGPNKPSSWKWLEPWEATSQRGKEAEESKTAAPKTGSLGDVKTD